MRLNLVRIFKLGKNISLKTNINLPIIINERFSFMRVLTLLEPLKNGG